VVQDREKLDHLKDRIDLISRLKELHDFLHDLQIQVYPQILDYVDVLETDPGARFGLAQILVQLGEDCKRARKTAAGLPDDDPDRDATWLTDLENALPILQSAAQAKDAHVAREATSPFRSGQLHGTLEMTTPDGEHLQGEYSIVSCGAVGFGRWMTLNAGKGRKTLCRPRKPISRGGGAPRVAESRAQFCSR
jgi:hypothetical protein